MIKGIVKKIVLGALNAEVTVDIGNGIELVSQITIGSVHRLNLAEGKPAYAVIKVDSVMIAVDD